MIRLNLARKAPPGSLRIGCVPYLNAKPLLEGLEGVVLKPPADLVGELVGRKLDVALLPVIEVIRRKLDFVPGVAIASPGKVESVRLWHAVPIPDVKVLALDRNSRTSNLLARVILEERYGLRPKCVVRDPAAGLTFRGVDAAVTIGDTSFRSAGVPYLDLGSEWKALTGKPFVFALWAFRKGHPKAREIVRTIRAAKARGIPRTTAIAKREAKRLGLPAAFCRRYLTECITFDLGAAERAGLRKFAGYAEERS
jgi:predicted solute-binding protein